MNHVYYTMIGDLPAGVKPKSVSGIALKIDFKSFCYLMGVMGNGLIQKSRQHKHIMLEIRRENDGERVQTFKLATCLAVK